MEVESMQIEDSSSLKQLGIRNAIQTNFGDDYVFQIASGQDVSALAVSLSTKAIKFYSPQTGQYFGECRGHSGTINEISFAQPYAAHVMHSCSSDGTIRAWDTRTFKQVSLITSGASQEIFSFGIGGSTGNLLAAGCNSQIRFWDVRNEKQVACLEDSHVEDITQVDFAPYDQSKLISASVDGLICVFDTNGQINDDSHLESVMNVGTSVAKIGFFGQKNQNLWCLTHIETLSVWDWKDARVEVDFQEARYLASQSWKLNEVDYFVDCHYSAESDGLWVIGGTNSGSLCYFPIYHQGPGAIGSPQASLVGGHTGVVRTILPVSNVHSSNPGIFGWTGGEDGRLCCWLSDESSGPTNSWISSNLVMKSPKFQKKSRHRPY